MKKIILLFLILSQLFTIIIISKKIWKLKYDKRSETLIPLKRDKLIVNRNSNLKYFYEPIPNSEIVSEYKVNWITEPYKYHINSDTLNDNKEYSINKPQNTYRIIALGDSYTYGMFVNTGENWTELLETSLREKCIKSNFEVINLGMAGYDIQYSLERFKIRGLKYDPDLVIWLLQNNDFEELSEIMREKEASFSADLKKTGAWQEMVKKGIPYPPERLMTNEMHKLSEKIGNKEIIEIQKNYLTELNNIYTANLVYFTFPNTSNFYKDVIKDIVEKRKNSFYRELKNIYKIEGATFLPNDTHPTKKGYKIIAEDILNYLIEYKILSCK